MSIRKILFLAVAGIMISPALMAADIDARLTRASFRMSSSGRIVTLTKLQEVY